MLFSPLKRNNESRSVTGCRQLLSALKKAHTDLSVAMAAVDILTRNPLPSRAEFTNMRWQVSKASLSRRLLWGRILRYLLPKVGTSDSSKLALLQSADMELLHLSARHVDKWTAVTVEADWLGYCKASAAIRARIMTSINAEQRLLYPILEHDGRGI